VGRLVDGWFVFVGFALVAALVGDPVGVVTGLTVGDIDVAAGVGTTVGMDVGGKEESTEHFPHVAPLWS
jgi:hypothetical protein